MTTRLQVIRQILFEWRQSQSTFGIRQLASELENRMGVWCLEDTARKEADMLKGEIPFTKAGKGIRRFISEPEQLTLGGI